ncbi:uncharacterized protein FA14DRAFT_162630 [Meira miltonrushii]|uniref:Uncharacterized protein n=1 Tax=Meira miltonrushii TaxID=1280837 RepID=A0A316V2G9_9BASI|nr:uncharacterized protein FA14DRAFT_162630 [Meira miltonrushii]PWN31710.1 hypothetical protein FA14DRAFT_162630 [Meira miltonrushii]
MLRKCIQDTYRIGLMKHGLQRAPMNRYAISKQLRTIKSSPQPLWKQQAGFNSSQYNSVLPGNSRWQSTKAETEEQMEKVKRVILGEEKLYTKSEKEWRIPESEAEPPKVLKPFLYFIGIGVTSYTIAAWLVIKDTTKGMQDAVKLYDQLPELRSKYKDVVRGSWGSLGSISERDLKIVEYHQAVMKQEEREKRVAYWCKLLRLPKELNDGLIQATRWMSGTYMSLSGSEFPSAPIIALSTVIFLGFDISRTGIFGKNTFVLLRKHLVHYPAANRIYTLTMSGFTHARFGSFLINATVLFFLGNSVLAGSGYFPHRTPERNRSYHLLAFCITAATLTSLSSQIFSRLLFMRATKLYGSQVARKTVGRMPQLGAIGISTSLAGISSVQLIAFAEQKYHSMQEGRKEFKQAMDTFALLNFFYVYTRLVFLAMSLFQGNMATRGNPVAVTGLLFGFTYSIFGLDYWEHLKQIFAERDQRLQLAIYQSHQLAEKKLKEFYPDLYDRKKVPKKRFV